MFVGHYSVAFALKARDRTIPLWVLFIAVQLLDVFWAPFVALGIEKVRIVPGITRTNPLDLYYMPYTHSLVAALGWSVLAYLVYRLARSGAAKQGALLVALAVFSHWVLDLLVHRPDLALYDNTAKVGLGLWNFPLFALALEVGLFFGGMALYLRAVRPPRRTGWIIFGLVAVAIHVVSFFGPPPPSGLAIAITAELAYGGYAVTAWLLERPKVTPAG